jgi:hypothetical protein
VICGIKDVVYTMNIIITWAKKIIIKINNLSQAGKKIIGTHSPEHQGEL